MPAGRLPVVALAGTRVAIALRLVKVSGRKIFRAHFEKGGPRPAHSGAGFEIRQQTAAKTPPARDRRDRKRQQLAFIEQQAAHRKAVPIRLAAKDSRHRQKIGEFVFRPGSRRLETQGVKLRQFGGLHGRITGGGSAGGAASGART